jgi:hypothetical protein
VVSYLLLRLSGYPEGRVQETQVQGQDTEVQCQKKPCGDEGVGFRGTLGVRGYRLGVTG